MTTTLAIADRVAETATNAGLSAFVLNGAVDSRHITFETGVGNAVLTPYVGVHRTSGQWEYGYGITSVGGLTRVAVISNSAQNTSLINFSSGTVDVFQDVGAEFLTRLDDFAVQLDGSGANSAAAQRTIRAPRSTGNATPAPIVFQVGHVQASGSTIQPWTTVLTLGDGSMTLASGATFALAGTTVSGAPTWSSSQAITLSTAAQPNVTSLGTQAANFLFVDNLYDIGASGATRPRNIFAAGTGTFGGTLVASNLTGTNTGDQTTFAASALTGTTMAAAVTASSLTSFGTLAADLLFVDATYDIGKSGATRPRNIFASGTGTFGGAFHVLGTGTFDQAVAFGGNITFGTDNSFDIGQTAALRPRNYFGAGTGTFGGSVTADRFVATSSSSGGVTVLSAPNGTTGWQAIAMVNTSGSALFGVESSVGGTLITGTTAYEVVVGSRFLFGTLAFASNNQVHMRLDASGGLTVDQSITTSGAMIMIGSSDNFGWFANTNSLILSNETTVSALAEFSAVGALRLFNYGAGAATFDASGNITSVSDERHKTDIKPFRRGMKDLRGIKPITYRYNGKSGMETEHFYTGFSAQNVRQHIPEAVSERADGLLSFADRPVLAAVVNAMQDFDERLEQLERRAA